MKTGTLILIAGTALFMVALFVAELSLVALGVSLPWAAALLWLITSVTYITTRQVREVRRYRRRVHRDFTRRTKARKAEASTSPPRPARAVTPCAHTEAVPVESSVTGETIAALCPTCGDQLTAEFLGCPHIHAIDTPSMGEPPGRAICNDCGTSGWYGSTASVSYRNAESMAPPGVVDDGGRPVMDDASLRIHLESGLFNHRLVTRLVWVAKQVGLQASHEQDGGWVTRRHLITVTGASHALSVYGDFVHRFLERATYEEQAAVLAPLRAALKDYRGQ